MDWVLLVVVMTIDGGYNWQPSPQRYPTQAACEAAINDHVQSPYIIDPMTSIVTTGCIKDEQLRSFIMCRITDENGNDRCPYRRRK